MPILKSEIDISPADLLQQPASDQIIVDPAQVDLQAVHWWCVYTLSRQEKVLMRKLLAATVDYCCPLIEKKSRSPNGRLRSSYLPLFSNYVFIRGNDDGRRVALATNCVQTCQRVIYPQQLVHDLNQIYFAIQNGAAVTAEARLQKGDPVMIKSGPFKGFEGFVQRRSGKTRFLIHLRYLEQGVSMEIDEAALVAT